MPPRSPLRSQGAPTPCRGSKSSSLPLIALVSFPSVSRKPTCYGVPLGLCNTLGDSGGCDPEPSEKAESSGNRRRPLAWKRSRQEIIKKGSPPFALNCFCSCFLHAFLPGSSQGLVLDVSLGFCCRISHLIFLLNFGQEVVMQAFNPRARRQRQETLEFRSA